VSSFITESCQGRFCNKTFYYRSEERPGAGTGLRFVDVSNTPKTQLRHRQTGAEYTQLALEL
jgi:hypothetical protein